LKKKAIEEEDKRCKLYFPKHGRTCFSKKKRKEREGDRACIPVTIFFSIWLND